MGASVVIEFDADNQSEAAFNRVLRDIDDLTVESGRATDEMVSDSRRLARMQIQDSERAARTRAQLLTQLRRDEAAAELRRVRDNEQLSARERRVQSDAIRDRLQSQTRQIQAEREINLERLRNSRVSIQSIATEERRLASERRRNAREALEQERARQQALRETLLILANFGREISFIGGEFVRVAAQTETLRATLNQFATDADALFRRLQTEARNLIGIDLDSFVQNFVQLRAAGADAEESISIIRGFTLSLGELGVVGPETLRFFGQLRQLFSANRIEGDDVKTLIEVLPTFLRIASTALGRNVESWKELQGAVEASGRTVRQFVVDLARQQEQVARGIPVDSFRGQSERFRDALQELNRTLGRELLPVLTRGVRALTSFTRAISGLPLRNIAIFTGAMLAATAAAAPFARAIVQAFTGFITITNAVRSLGPVTIPASVQLQQLSVLIGTNLRAALARGVAGLVAFGKAILTTQIAMSTWLPIVGLVVAAIAAISVHMATASRRASEFARSMAQIGDNIGRTAGAFGRLNVEQLQSRIANLTRESERLNAELRETDVDPEQFVRLSVQLGVVTRGIRIYRGELERVKSEAEDAARANNTYAASLGRLNVELAFFERDIIGLNQVFQRALEGQDIGAIRRSAEALITQERINSARRIQIFAEGENTREQIQANAVQQSASLINREIAINEQAQGRITEIRREARERIERQLRQFFTFETAALEARIRAEEEAAARNNRIASAQRQTQRDFQAQVISDVNARDAAERDQQRQSVRGTRAYYESLRRISAVFRQQALDDLRADLNVAEGYVRGLGARIQNAFLSFIPRDLLPDDLVERVRNRLRQIEEDTRSANQRIVDIQQATESQLQSLVVDSAFDIAFQRNRSFREIAVSFLQQSLRIIVQSHIETNTILSNNARIIASNQAVAASRRQAFAPAGGIPGLGNFNFGNIGGLATGGAGALGVAGLLFGRQFGNLSQGIGNILTDFIGNLESLVEGGEGGGPIFFNFDDGTSRKVVERGNFSLRRLNRNLNRRR